MSDFNLNDFGGGKYKRVTQDWLKGFPKSAVRGVISDTKVVTFKNRETGKDEDVPIILITSPVGTWDGEYEFALSSKANISVLKAAYGVTKAALVGKEVGLYIDPTVMYAGKATGGVRIKTFQPDPFANEPIAAPPTTPDATGDSIPF